MLMMMLHRRFRPKSISLPKVFSLLTILKVPSPLVAHQCSGGSLVLYLWIYILCICQTCEGSLPSAVGAGVVGFPKTAPLGINNRAADTNADQVKEGKREECEYLQTEFHSLPRVRVSTLRAPMRVFTFADKWFVWVSCFSLGQSTPLCHHYQ